MQNAECGMQNDKMTNEEVIKAFIETYEQYNAKGGSRTFVYEEVLDLINRQKANLDDKEETIQFADKEIKRLNAEIERYKGVIKILENDVKDAWESAVKEFAHLIIDKAESGGVIHAMDIPDYVVDFLKEKKNEK